MPQVVFHHNPCELVSHIYQEDGDWSAWIKTIITGDPSHHKSHKEPDEYCEEWTNPLRFPDLRKDGDWRFKFFAAELTKVWYGGFESICRNMDSTQYNFFLEDMVELRNVWVCDRLTNSRDIEYIGYCDGF